LSSETVPPPSPGRRRRGGLLLFSRRKRRRRRKEGRYATILKENFPRSTLTLEHVEAFECVGDISSYPTVY